MRTTAGILLYLGLLICFSCEEQGWIGNCDDCASTEPDRAVIEGKVDKDGLPAMLRIYEGELENDILYTSFMASGPGFELPVLLNKKYTVTATYQIDGDTYIAVDSAFPRVKYTKEQCEDPCYFVYDRIVDLRIKYLAGGE
jgi:hypothetical protein